MKVVNSKSSTWFAGADELYQKYIAGLACQKLFQSLE